jgi:hypothetical protein
MKFTIKGNLVVMNSFYHKIAIVSVCTALTFTLGANQEAKAVTFTLTAPRFLVQGNSEFGGIEVITGDYSGPSIEYNASRYSGYSGTRAFYEFNIGNLSLAPDTVISRAFFNVRVRDIIAFYRHFVIDILGYVGNGIPELSDFEIGERLGLIDIARIADYPYPEYPINIDVTQFVNQRVSNGDAFAGFGLRGSTDTYFYGTASLGNSVELTIETEPVPEPTTIFGSALALGVGGWLKRKKLGQQSKKTSQH